jgi:diamine N-acetyltransferase
MKLENELVRLRALEPSDVDLLYAWENDPAVWGVTNTLIPFSKDTLRKYIDSVQDIFADRQFRYVIESMEDNRPVGLMDLFEYEPMHHRVGLGILIASENDRKKGYAKAALQITMAYCQVVLQLKTVFCNVLKSNEASVKLFSGQGFLVSGTKHSWHRTGNVYEDEFFMQKIF